MDKDFEYKYVVPEQRLQIFVESFWMLRNHSKEAKKVVILPDGRVDLFFSRSTEETFHISLSGIGTQPEQAEIAPDTITFAISFRLPGVEYILKHSIAGIIDTALLLPENFWDVEQHVLNDFEQFCQTMTARMLSSFPLSTDDRKLKLFDLIYGSNGSFSVQKLSEEVCWTSRQINRYFDQHFGLPLKSYCGILRFRASFPHIKNGKLSPEENFTDQSHFIREIKKLSGVLPKELRINQNDRFIQFSTIPVR
ncbi:AraC family transcriptional regulator [Dyadobacter luteus]|jgi:AraC-like DNA-binding protein|uniref:AraC family transcriptional regulator n=1 Tax=Dyadobacter luteus TaxID=2259619 RepID=A0A3D8YFB7_9BACT|nr:AraC family transcriptional regulator [Dyadobacter luteus]REA63185.1 AraC family transcriptional regulator [Dyadobacter luteus]